MPCDTTLAPIASSGTAAIRNASTIATAAAAFFTRRFRFMFAPESRWAISAVVAPEGSCRGPASVVPALRSLEGFTRFPSCGGRR